MSLKRFEFHENIMIETFVVNINSIWVNWATREKLDSAVKS